MKKQRKNMKRGRASRQPSPERAATAPNQRLRNNRNNQRHNPRPQYNNNNWAQQNQRRQPHYRYSDDTHTNRGNSGFSNENHHSYSDYPREYCEWCGRSGNTSDSCTKHLWCEYCSRRYHTSQDCREKAAEERRQHQLISALRVHSQETLAAIRQHTAQQFSHHPYIAYTPYQPNPHHPGLNHTLKTKLLISTIPVVLFGPTQKNC